MLVVGGAVSVGRFIGYFSEAWLFAVVYQTHREQQVGPNRHIYKYSMGHAARLFVFRPTLEGNSIPLAVLGGVY